MRIAIDVSPLQSGHKVRGVGFYLLHLKDALNKYFPEHEYTFFTQEHEPQGKIDVVHYPYFDPFFITLPLIRKHPTVVTIHDLTPLVFPEHFPAGLKGRFRWKIQKHNARNVDMIIADSQASKEDIVKIIDANPSKVEVTYLAPGEEFQKKAVSIKEKIELHKKYNLLDTFILYVGDVTWNKNVPAIIQAALKAKVPLVMVGKSLVQEDFDKNNPWNKDLVEVQNLCGSNKTVQRLGFVPTEDLVKLYNMASLFIMPSHYEGFGLPVIEAMQSGCPVITSKGGSLAEVAGQAAYYVNDKDIDSISQGILEVYNDRKLQQSLSEKGLHQAKKFTWKKTAEETIEIYKSVVKENNL
jgi:glycosyltransferase involved in cell wall biosynthesis